MLGSLLRGMGPGNCDTGLLHTFTSWSNGEEKWTETRTKEKRAREPWANEGGSIPSRKTEGPEGRET